MEIRVNAKIDIDDVIDGLSYSESMETMKNIDIHIADVDFTKEIIVYLFKDLQKGDPKLLPEHFLEWLKEGETD